MRVISVICKSIYEHYSSPKYTLGTNLESKIDCMVSKVSMCLFLCEFMNGRCRVSASIVEHPHQCTDGC